MANADSASADLTGEHVKEVFAYFGRAIYLAQLMEAAMVNIIAYLNILEHRGRCITSKNIDELFSKGDLLTMGKLINMLKDQTSLSFETERKLHEAWKIRNVLVQHYFRERSATFTMFQGRKTMLNELESYWRVLDDAREDIDALGKPLFQQLGLTPEELEKQKNEILQGSGYEF